MNLEEFKQQCIIHKPDIIVQKYLIENDSFFFKEKTSDEEFDLKKDIATILQVHIRDIVIVGSGKLGFSLKPSNAENGLYLFKNFDSNSQKKSDLDIGVISPSLFDKEIRNLYEHTEFYKNNWSDRNSFAKYVLKGKIAIRFLPKGFSLTNEISKVVEKYQMAYGREVNIEIYKSWFYFETYHQENIKNIQVNLLR
jgi:hypothetical protein